MIKHNLRTARKQIGLSQTSLAEKIGTWQQTISTWENGESEPSASDLIQLADALGVQIEWLVRGDRPDRPAPVPSLETAGAHTA